GNGEVQEVLEKSDAAKVGRELGVDTVIYGAVTEYRYKKGVDEDPVVGITVRMLDIPETRILWAESVTATGSTYAGSSSLSTLAHALCSDMVDTLVDRLK
ncbi:MAG: GNA1162 family protein, partial [Desulfovibrionaceae bacterium]